MSLPKDVIASCQALLADFPPGLLDRLKRSWPSDVYEKAHAYPVSMPTLWQDADENVIDWNVNAEKPLHLYVHIPWCKTRCTFCCYEQECLAPPADSVFDRYLSCLIREFRIHKKRLKNNKFLVDVLYIGGGTPSALTASQIRKLLRHLRDEMVLTDTASIIAEVSPGTVDAEKLRILREGGINRISMGVQSFDDTVLKRCRRDHGADDVCKVSAMIRDVGFEEVNFDIMLSLPGQTLNSFYDTVSTALALSPSSISFLDLRVIKGTLLREARGQADHAWENIVHMRAICQEMLKADARYLRTRPHYFVRTDEARSRVTRSPCLDSRGGPGFQVGLGVTAYSQLGDVCFRNAKNPYYEEMVRNGKLPVGTAVVLKDEDKLAVTAIRSLVDQLCIPKTSDIISKYGPLLTWLKKHECIDDEFRLTESGILFAEEIVYLLYPNHVAR
jgi:oxygen-independent coproporphyrinogen-3 oxidase